MSDPYERQRNRMVDRQIAPSDIEDPRILDAMREVPRHLFVPEDRRAMAYGDHPVQVGHGQTISQPYIVALTIQLGDVQPGDKVLDVGTGSGYQAAVLAEMGAEVYTIEIVPDLAEQAAEALAEAGYEVHGRVGDAYDGWPEAAPFDAILVAAAADHVPMALKRQLKKHGTVVMPVGSSFQQALTAITRTGEDSWEQREGIPVLFVPMTGRAQDGS